ncbi:Yip1 family protein [Palleronia sp. LCG004]|uniref:Yip1 family protein n=1 Tax=Palleronia sp. LCG004 TaxID=3079304 RepID=UPI002942170D|nr:Yip1 family protein [Palleronia sp. LCG004]WOI57047.1 Yip1 family protein [Palleronia sp. LCG004]
MNLLSPRILGQLALDTVRAPRPTFARLRALDLDRGTLWQALLLVVVVSILLAELANMFLLATIAQDADPVLMLSPFAFGAMQLVVLIISVLLIDKVGRAFKGTGDLGDAILAVTWLQFVMVCLQILQGILLIVIPPLAGIVMILGLILFFWLLTNFVAELHGFDSLGRVFGMILFVLMGVALGLSFLLTLAGVSVAR